jgi:RNA-directed DNA polymerase
MSQAAEERPVAVPPGARRAGEAQGRWPWVEPSIWTERMLTALEQGVKGGKWFSLIDKITPETTLHEAFRQVATNRGAAGVDHVTVAMYEGRLDENLRRLSERLREGHYQPQAIRRHHIPKPGSQEARPLGIPMCRSYCTSWQRSWGLREGGRALPWARFHLRG